ncbi:aminoglycoside phosphotransferase [Actinomadura craniellae]|uniref:Maltokinase n=1 Tax=Actinomadura craniellae TaxID=2231787 RepID=A0A365GZV0_9ACTN|nr:phosphotransferase [Actinomadura craniellae]RAY12337.1 aminoglycoside phosphotransferase [Actinomadura craniellae]
MRAPERLEESLARWLPQQRWYAGKGREIGDVTIVSDTELVIGDPGLRHLILAVRQGDVVDHYQMLLGTRSELPRRLEYAGIGDEGPFSYDAVHDPELTRVLLRRLAEEARSGPLAFRHSPGSEIETDLDSLASPAEQSNTSLIYGETYVCKLFRRISPGLNPDLELNRGLAEAGCSHVPQLHGWIEMELAGETTTLAMLSEFLRAATDGWQLATTSVRDLYGSAELPADQAGGDFSAEAERLGAATASVHNDLAAAFGVAELPVGEVREMAERMHDQLAEACAVVPALKPYGERIGAAFDDLAKRAEPMPVQRLHGDYHLGQVMRTSSRPGADWVLLDFEGEPARPLAERRNRGHPLRDVAGMLRSFEYAARFLLPGYDDEDSGLEARAHEWADLNRSAFSRGYAAAGGPDPAAHRALTRAFEFDKAVYEVLYEAHNRPDWLHVPLGSLARLTA